MNLLESKPYHFFYDVIRKNKVLNHLAHKVMQSEVIRKFPPYTSLYNKMIQNKAQKYIKVPDILEFEITDKCNARCTMCPDEVHLGNDFLDHELFKRIAREGYELGIRRMIFTGGEPLLDKQVFDKIDYAKKLGFTYVHMFTNGSILTPKYQKKLLATELDSLTMSVDSAIKEEYERIRVGLKFDVVVENMQTLYAAKKSMNFEKPIIRINMLTLPENQNSRKAFIDIFKAHADICEIMDAHNFADTTEIKVSIENLVKSREYSQISRDPCHLMFIKACVTPKGYLKKCSIDHSSQALIADLSRVSLAEGLQTPRFLDIKQNHLAHKFSEPGCTNCTHRESWWVDY